jgi:ankyrin repeat protein
MVPPTLTLTVRLPMTQHVLAGCVDEDAAVDSTHTGVQLAARMGYVGAMEALLEAGADPNIYGPTRDSALRFAIRNEKV